MHGIAVADSLSGISIFISSFKERINMASEAHRLTAIYGIVLIIAAVTAYSVDRSAASTSTTGYAALGPDIEVKINSISPAVPKYLDKRITVNFAAKGAESTGVRNVLYVFTLAYPSGKKIGYTAYLAPVSQKSASKQFLWNLDQRGTYKLSLVADPHNNIREASETNNRDEIIFRI